MMILSLIPGVVGLLFLYYGAKAVWRTYILWNAKDVKSPYKNLPVPPGDFGLPIIGETHFWAVQGSQFNSIRRKQYGNAFSTNIIGRTMVKVTGTEYVKQILTANQNTVATIWPTTVQKVLGSAAIANSVGDIHKFRRNAFLKAFTREALNKYVPQIEQSVREQMHSWSLNINKTQLVYPETKFLTFDIAFRVLVGLTFRNDVERRELFKTFNSMIQNLLSLPYDVPGSGFRKALNAKNVIHKILDERVRKFRKQVGKTTKSERLREDEQRHSVLKIVLESQNKKNECHKEDTEILDPDDKGFSSTTNSSTVPCDNGDDLKMSDTELKETTVEMLFAGYMTTSSVATSAIINLISHPEVFRKLEEEFRHFGLLNGPHSEDMFRNSEDDFTPVIRQRRKDSDMFNNNSRQSFQKTDYVNENVLTVETLSKLTYLEQFFKETLRIMPPILGGYRLALKTFQLGEFRVPKGWTIIYNIRDTHESEWEEDMKFNPDRFSFDNCKNTKESRYRWIPFGGGARTCVGKEFARLQFKIFIIELIRHFSKIEFAKGKPPKMFAVPFLHPTDGLPVRLTRRKCEETEYQT